MKTNYFLKIFSVLFLAGIAYPSFCKDIKLEVHFPSDIDISKLYISYQNGLTTTRVNPIIKNNIFIFNDSCYDRYGRILFNYRDSMGKWFPGNSFWISDKPAKIIFSAGNNPTENPLKNYSLENVISLNELYEKKVDVTIRQANTDLNNYYNQNVSGFNANPEKRIIFHNKLDSIVREEVKLIKLHPDDYYFLYYFQDYVVSSQNSFTSTELLKFYTDVFPDSLKQTFKGKQIVKTLKSKINTKEGGESPDFSVKDIKGNVISLTGLRGKYVLLDFWASWCGPCMKLTPVIQEIRNKYPKDKLEIISITLDDNYTDFQAALKKTGVNWPQIFNNKDLINKYAIAPIPQVYLIDGNGKVIYNKEEENDTELVKLQSLLSSVVK